MRDITIVMPYYNCPHVLALHCGVWMSYPEEIKPHVKVIIVDDGSQLPALPVLRKMRIGIGISLFRVKDDIGWNCFGAKNLGMKHVTTEWVILADIDHALPANTLRFVLDEAELDDGAAYQFERYWPDGRQLKPHADSLLMRAETFWKAGGYDEDYTFKMGGGVFHNQIDCATGGRQVLPGARLIAIQGLIPSDAAPVTEAQKDDGRKRRREVHKLKADGKLPRKPTNYCRFDWEKQL